MTSERSILNPSRLAFSIHVTSIALLFLGVTFVAKGAAGGGGGGGGAWVVAQAVLEKSEKLVLPPAVLNARTL